MGTGKKALLVISFGTSYEEAFPAIVNVEETCRKAFPDYDFFRAFTSKMIIRKLKRTKDITIYSPEEILEQLAKEQYEEVICQPTHIIPGLEYEKLMGILEPYKDRFEKLCIGNSLLTEDADYESVAEALMQEVSQPLPEDEAFLLMGHGTSHSADSVYCRMEHVLRDLGYHHAFVGTVEGFPDIDYVVKRLHRSHIRKAYMMPLLIVAGDHARNDLAGEKEDSWKSILEREGLETEIILKGIGEIDAVARLYVKHAQVSILSL